MKDDFFQKSDKQPACCVWFSVTKGFQVLAMVEIVGVVGIVITMFTSTGDYTDPLALLLIQTSFTLTVIFTFILVGTID